MGLKKKREEKNKLKKEGKKPLRGEFFFLVLVGI
jgi:hypothetical protein